MIYQQSSIIDFMEIGKRVTTAREYAGLNKVELARATGMSKQAIGQIENGTTKEPTPSNLFKIAKATHVNPEWIITGYGHMNQVKEHQESYDLQLLSPNITEGPESKGQVPLISWVQAGDWCEAIDLFEVGDAERWLPCPVNHSDKTFILRVQGSSMEPEYRDGDLIFVDPSVQAEHNSDVIVRLENANTATFKRLQIVGDKSYLSPINRDWPEPVIPINEHAQICGVVIFSGRLR